MLLLALIFAYLQPRSIAICNKESKPQYKIGESTSFSNWTQCSISYSEILTEIESLKHVEDESVFSEEFRDNLLLRDDLLEGDILLRNSSLLNQLISQESSPLGTASSLGVPWPDGKVPFAFSDAFSLREQAKVVAAMGEIESVSCVTFNMREEEENFVKIYKGDGCASHVGFHHGAQGLSLSDVCLKSRFVILHQLLHALGFWHEHTRADRDDHITVHWENIKPDDNYQCNYRKFVFLPRGSLPYDSQSLLHIPSHAYAVSKVNPTFSFVRALEASKHNQRKLLSKMDIKKIIDKYNCYRRPKVQQTPDMLPEPSKQSLGSDVGNTSFFLPKGINTFRSEEEPMNFSRVDLEWDAPLLPASSVGNDEPSCEGIIRAHFQLSCVTPFLLLYLSKFF